MTDNNPHTNLENLVSKADTAVSAKQAQADEAIRKATTPRTHPVKTAFTLLLPVAFVGLLLYQYPRFIEPYPIPDPTKDASVAAADLEALAETIAIYKTATGRLPENLEAIGMPPEYRAFVKESGIVYKLNGDNFTLDWSLPKWNVGYDSSKEKVETKPSNS